jgi:hypothetical protein
MTTTCTNKQTTLLDPVAGTLWLSAEKLTLNCVPADVKTLNNIDLPACEHRQRPSSVNKAPSRTKQTP